MRKEIVPVSHVIRYRPRRNYCGCGFMNFKYFQTYAGLVKILQVILCGICKTILSNFGLKYASAIGFSYDALLSVTSASLITTSVLVITYLISENSMRLIRSSLFEIVFNGCCCLEFMGACSWLMLTVQAFLYPQFLVTPFFIIYPLMLMVNILGFILSIFYGIDSYLAYKYFMGYR